MTPSDCPKQPRWRDKQAIAEHFGISLRHVTNLQRRRILPYSYLGRTVRFDVHACDAAIKALELKSVLLRAENNI